MGLKVGVSEKGRGWFEVVGKERGLGLGCHLCTSATAICSS